MEFSGDDGVNTDNLCTSRNDHTDIEELLIRKAARPKKKAPTHPQNDNQAPNPNGLLVYQPLSLLASRVIAQSGVQRGTKSKGNRPSFDHHVVRRLFMIHFG